MNADTAGLVRMVGLVLRRNWLRMLIWALVLAGMTAAVIESQRQAFPTQADRDLYAQIANTPAVAALTGLPYAAATLGGILNIKLWMTNAIVLALVCIFLVTRNGRGEEEAGRTELVRAGALGRHSYSLASWLITAGYAVVAGLACTGAVIAMGLPADGALVQGASFAGLAIAFIGVAAVANQLSSTARGANAIAGVALAVAYVIRAIADVRAEGETPAWYSWLSPIGWAQQMRSFGENAWWPLGLLVAFGAIGCGAALALEARRDLGTGVLPDRPGPRGAAALTRTVLGLPLRLQRTAIIAWTLGAALTALFCGAVAKLFSDLLDRTDSPFGDALQGDAASALDALLGYFLMATTLVVAAFAVQSAAVVRLDEAAGRTELQWSAATSRIAWAGARLAIPAIASLLMLLLSGLLLGGAYGATIGDPSQAGRFALYALAYWPPILLLIAITGFLAAWLPRAAIAIAWGLFAAFTLLAVLGNIFGLPDELVNATPFTVVPNISDANPDWGPLWILGGIAALLAVLGLWRLRARDMASA